MLETDLYQWTIRKLRGATVKLQAIESGSTGLGIPDWFYRTLTIDGWIEAKCLKDVKEIVKIPFRPGQFSWLMNYTKLHGNALLFVQHKEWLTIFQGMMIQREYTIDEFLRQNVMHESLDNITKKMLYSILSRGNK